MKNGLGAHHARHLPNDDGGEPEPQPGAFQPEPEPEVEPEPEPEAAPDAETSQSPRKRAASTRAGPQPGDDKKSKGDNEETTSMATKPIKAFLDMIREGWGGKFGASFAAEGLETDEDIDDLENPEYQGALDSLLARLLKGGARSMQLERIKNQFAPRASDEPRGESAGVGDVAVRAAAANDKAAAGDNDEAAAAAAAASIAPNDHGSGGDSEVPQRGEDDVRTFLENISVGCPDLFLLPLKAVGVSCATTLGHFAGAPEAFITLQVESFAAPPFRNSSSFHSLALRRAGSAARRLCGSLALRLAGSAARSAALQLARRLCSSFAGSAAHPPALRLTTVRPKQHSILSIAKTKNTTAQNGCWAAYRLGRSFPS